MRRMKTYQRVMIMILSALFGSCLALVNTMASTGSTLQANNFTMLGTTSGSITFNSGASPTPKVYNLSGLTTSESANYFIQTDGSGNFKFASAVTTAPTLAAVLAQGSVTGSNNITYSASQQENWASGGTYTNVAPESFGPLDQGMYYSSGGPASGASNTSAQSIYMVAAPGTGNATPTDARIQTSTIGASGTTLETEIDRVWVRGKNFSVTNNTATTFCTLTNASDTGVGLVLTYNVRAQDGSHNIQHETGLVVFDGINSNGSITVAAPSKWSNQTCSTGTLTVTFTETTGSSLVNLQITVNTSLTATTEDVTFTCFNNGIQGIAPQ